MKINLRKGTGWKLLCHFSDRHPDLSKNLFTELFEKTYRCRLYKDIHLDSYYMEFTPKAWTWFCLQHDINHKDIVK